MQKNLKNYFTTGEFARLCNVKKHTLFHYDQIGILCPEIVMDNGYRYYSHNQLEIFYTISMLKELDMPLADIKRYLDQRSPLAFLELLEQQQKEVTEKIKELQWLERFIRTKMELTQEGLSIPMNQILLENRSEEYLIVTKYEGEDEDKAITAAMTEHLNFCHSLDIYSAYAIGGMIPTEGIVSRKGYFYSHFYTKVNELEFPSAVTRPAGIFAVCCDNQGYRNVEAIADRLLQYAKEHDFQPGPYIYEDVLLDDMSVMGYDQYTVKLSLPLLK